MSKIKDLGEWNFVNYLTSLNEPIDREIELRTTDNKTVCTKILNAEFAHLISASPDMYKALNLVLEAFKKNGYYLPVAVIDAVEFALMKAEGIAKVDYEE